MAMRFDGGRSGSKSGGSFDKSLAAITNPQTRLAGSAGYFAPPTGSGTVLKPAAPLRTAAAPSRGTTAPTQRSGGGGGGTVYGGGGGGVAPMAMAAPAAPPMSESDYLNSDDVYLAALSRYNKNFDDLEADITRRQGDYDVQYKNSLGDLGYLGEQAPGGKGQWDFQNQQTAAGRGFQALIQDFAARGLLHSGDYLGAQNDFVGTLGKQLDSMNLAKQQFGEGLNQERTTGRSSRDAGVGQARAEALARMQQLYGAV